MDADLDTLATALYARVDDTLKEHPELVPWRPKVGIAPKLSDAELLTLAVLQVLQGFNEEARWLRHADTHLRHLFPYLPGQADPSRTFGVRHQTFNRRAVETGIGARCRVRRCCGRGGRRGSFGSRSTPRLAGHAPQRHPSPQSR